MTTRTKGIPGVAVAAIAVGSLLMYCGIKDVPVVDALRAILRGQVPTPRPSAAPETGLTDAQIADFMANAARTETLPRGTNRDPNAPGLK